MAKKKVIFTFDERSVTDYNQTPMHHIIELTNGNVIYLPKLPGVIATNPADEITDTERAERLEAMVDRMAEKLSGCTLLVIPICELCLQIEMCGASVELTKASTMANDIMRNLMDALEMKNLPPGSR